MHHFIYPSQDTFITNTLGFEDLNFGIDEILRVGTSAQTVRVPKSTDINEPWEEFTCPSSSWDVWSLIWGTNPTGSYSTYAVVNTFTQRALVQFDLTSISASMSAPSGSLPNIVDPTFRLKLKVAREFNLPITYKIYAFPISESWVMGDGYISDDGSDIGASWIYRDRQNGTPWAVTGSSYIQSLSATQSFDYQVGDINMDITPIVNAWINGTIPNNGILLVSSDEFSPTGSGMGLYFFSKDTNTIYEPVLDVGWNSGSNAYSWTTGSTYVSGVTTSSVPAGLNGIVSDDPMISGSLWGGFNGLANLSNSSSISYSYDTASLITSSFTTVYSNGFISAFGIDGLITSMSINGHISGTISSSNHSASAVTHCKTCQPSFSKNWGGMAQFAGGQDQTQYQGHDIYGWGDPFNEFNQYNWWQFPSNQQLVSPVTFHFTGPYLNISCSCGAGNSVLLIENPWWVSSSYTCNPTKSYTGGNQWVSSDNTGAGPCGSDNAMPTGSTTCSIHMSFLMGTIIDGFFSGSTFTSSLINGFILGYGRLVGGWDVGMILGTQITASYPFKPFYPSASYVQFVGPYVNGPAFGGFTALSASYGLVDWGIFDGVFTGGNLMGANIHAPFTGSILSASIVSSSFTLTSSVILPVEFDKPFATVIQNIPSTVKAGNIIRVNVFARPEFPLKNFNRQTQFNQFLIPQYLPTASYYAIKDNETEEIILDFDNYTQLSCDPNGNYFMLDTTGFPQERYFRILIKTEQSGSIYTFDKGNIFKIVR